MPDVFPGLPGRWEMHPNLPFEPFKYDELVKSPKDFLSVIPAKAGIQLFQGIIKSLDSGVHRSDDFLRGHQI